MNSSMYVTLESKLSFKIWYKMLTYTYFCHHRAARKDEIWTFPLFPMFNVFKMIKRFFTHIF